MGECRRGQVVPTRGKGKNGYVCQTTRRVVTRAHEILCLCAHMQDQPNSVIYRAKSICSPCAQLAPFCQLNLSINQHSDISDATCFICHKTIINVTTADVLVEANQSFVNLYTS